MNAAMREMAKKAEIRPFYLASVLRLYMDSERMNEAELSQLLGCTEEVLPHIQLCRAPRSEAEGFQEDVLRVAAEFNLDASALAKACRLGGVMRTMTEAKAEGLDAYMAARDRKDEDPS